MMGYRVSIGHSLLVIYSQQLNMSLHQEIPYSDQRSQCVLISTQTVTLTSNKEAAVSTIIPTTTIIIIWTTTTTTTITLTITLTTTTPSIARSK